MMGNYPGFVSPHPLVVFDAGSIQALHLLNQGVVVAALEMSVKDILL